MCTLCTMWALLKRCSKGSFMEKGIFLKWSIVYLIFTIFNPHFIITLLLGCQRNFFCNIFSIKILPLMHCKKKLRISSIFLFPWLIWKIWIGGFPLLFLTTHLFISWSCWNWTRKDRLREMCSGLQDTRGIWGN